MFEPKKTIVAFVFVILILILSGSLGLSDRTGEELPSLQEDVGDTSDVSKTLNNDGIDTGTDPGIDPAIGDISFSSGFYFAYKEYGNRVEQRTMSVSYSFSAPTMVKNGEFDLPVMTQLHNEMKPGMPMIPVKNAKILLPQGEIPRDIKVIAKSEAALEGTYFIKPGEMPVTFDSDNISSPDPLNSSVYNSEDMYPGVLCSEAVIQEFRGFQILILELYPMHYIPAQGKVLYFERIDLSVTTFYIGEKSPLYRGLARDRNLVESIVDNPSASATYELKTGKELTGGIIPMSITNASESYDYVIITNDILAPSFQSLADYKNDSGIKTVVVKVEDIISDPDYDGIDNQTRIRNFIRDAYTNWSIDYVLLGGDDEIIPHRGCHGYVVSLSGPEEDFDIPTDMYYAGLDGNWDNDGDGIYGEKDSTAGGNGTNGEESDLWAEVYVGRAPVNTATETQSFVDKVIFFEANPRPKHVTLHGEKDSKGNKIDDVKDGGDGTLAAPGVESYIPSVYNITHLYESEGDAITKAIWEAEIANDTLFVNHGGHGLTNSYEIKGAGPISYTKSDAVAVTNDYYPIHLSIACYSGSFDGRKPDGSYVSGRDCIAEGYINNPYGNGGVVACILNSRYGWFTTGDVTAYSGQLDNEFYNQLFNHNMIHIGRTLQEAKEVYAPTALTHNTYRWVLYEWNLLGDPTLQIFGKDNVTPVANAGPDNWTYEDSPIVLDGSASTDDSGYLAWYNWTLGDGNYLNGSGSAYAKLEYTYVDPGFYTVVLNVSDAWGNWDNDTVNITVYDATPPTTLLTIGIPKFRENAMDDWNVTQKTDFTLSASDEYSGVNFTWYTIDGQYFEYVGEPFNLSVFSEGAHYMTWGSEDNASVNETGNAMLVYLDKNPPTTTLDIWEPKHREFPSDSWNVTDSTIFVINSTDPYSGVDFIWYMIDGEYFEEWAFNFIGYDDGMHAIVYGSQDNISHNETGNIITVYVDTTPPTTFLDIGEPKSRAKALDNWNVTGNTLFTILPYDTYSGVDIIWYKIDGEYFEGPTFTLDGYLDGKHTIVYGARDMLGNNETGTPISVILDTQSPSTSLNIFGPKYRGPTSDQWNVSSQTSFSLIPTDIYSDVNFTWYTINGQYFEGINFDLDGYIEGMHTITWGSEDNLGNNETGNIMIVWLDNSKPITDLTLGPERYPINGYDGCNVTPYTAFTLSPQDYPVHNSGIKRTWYTINNTYYEGASFTLLGFDQGPYTITWGSIDNLGHNETGNFILVYVDKRPPTTTLEVGMPRHRDDFIDFYNVTETTPFFINSTDPYSGVNFTWYFIDGQYFEGMSFTSFNLAGFENGPHTIVYGGQDNLGHNITVGKKITVILDLTPPNSTLHIGDPKTRADPQDHWNVTGSTLFIITSNDTYSGVNTSWYTIDGEYFEGSIFTLDGYPDGMHTITCGARDWLGNNETGNTTIVFADTHPPITNLTLSSPKYRSGDGDVWNVTSQTIFNLEAVDHYSEVAFTWYIIDWDYFEGTSFNLSGYAEGPHLITWGSVDFSGNNETGKSMLVLLDDSPPSTEMIVDLPKYRHSDDDHWNVTEQSIFTLSQTDSGSGVGTVWYTIDGAYFEGFEFNLSGYADGEHTLTWGSSDNLNNNETSNFMVVYLDNTPPTTLLSLGKPKYRSDELHSWNVTQGTFFNLIASDEQCGVSFVWYTIDDKYFKGSDFLLTGRIDGLHIITWGALDHLGNNETANYLQVNLDTKPPSMTIYIGGQVPPPNTKVTLNSSTPVTLVADDGIGVGVDYIWFSLDGGSTYNLYESQFTVPLNTSTIIYGAKDILGANATGITIRVVVDDREPEIDDGDDDGDEPPPPDKGIFEMLMDYFYLLIMLIVIVVVLLLIILLSRRKKGKEDTVSFQVEDQKEEAMVEFEEEVDSAPPPPPPPPPPSE